MFHAFTGCDTVASFAGIKTAFDIWKSFNGVTPIFSTLLTDPSELNDDYMSVLEAFVVLKYDRTCTETTVNLARKHIYGQLTTSKSSPLPAHKTSSIPGWICVGAGTRPLSIYSFPET